jgi:ribosomal protein S18 acetylase RimI-like enzyme
MNQNFSFRAALPGDALRLSFLFAHVYIDTYGVEGVTHEFAHFMEKRFSSARIESLISEVPDALQVATCDGHIAGAAEMIWRSECPHQGIIAPELSKLYVLERFCGLGLGHGLLRRAELLAKTRGARQVWLEVYALNPRAIAFYKRQGYNDIGRNDFQMEVNCYENRVLLKEL